jgi:hypothetical protein
MCNALSYSSALPLESATLTARFNVVRADL